MESQELKMLIFLSTYNKGEDDFLAMLYKDFKSYDFAGDLINKLNKNGYTYVKADSQGFNLGNTECILTDKGKKYLKSNKMQRYFIENNIGFTIFWDILKNLVSLKN